MKDIKTPTTTQKKAIAGWEDDGGARVPGNEVARVESDRRTSDRDHLDASHDSDARGEHRYPDTHQTPTEQQARQHRDDLKARLGGPGPASGRRR
jgi:hypothetical protein